MAQVLIRNIDDDVVARLRRKAEALGLSLESFLRDRLAKEAGPSRAEIVAAIEAVRKSVRPWAPGDQTADEIVREMRDERTRHQAALHGLKE